MPSKIALVTGASRGLGRSMALHLAATGVSIVGTYHSKQDEAHDVLDRVRALGVEAAMLQLDVGRSDTFADFAATLGSTLSETFGRSDFDFLVNNAGIGIYAPFTDTTEEQFDELLRTQLKGPFFLSQTLLPHIVDGGRILNVSSGLARFTLPGYAAYASTKGGIEVLTRYMAKELGARGITVNVIAPGAIETDFSGGATRDVPEVNKAVSDTVPLGRAGLPEDIGPAVAALLSDAMAWTNGARIEVSGGQNI